MDSSDPYQAHPPHDTGRTHAIEVAAARFATRSGWCWDAAPVLGAPGWYVVWQHGEQSHDRLVGGRILLGPGEVVVLVSSNPLIHGFAQTAAVLAESGASGLSGPELAVEIQRRTAQASG